MKTSMDVIQFGKWISERRRKCGWSSQRALSETLRNDPFLQEWRISEDFIARLEAGRLAHPFRGQVRQQILVLAQVLCKTPREVQSYLHAASLKELSPEETVLVQRIHDYLALEQMTTVELLPARPPYLVGRATVVENLLERISSHGQGLYAITGMPGVGKSVLAHEVMHYVAADELRRLFHDGIVTLSCKDRKGSRGLLSLFEEIIDIFTDHDGKHKQVNDTYTTQQKQAMQRSSAFAKTGLSTAASVESSTFPEAVQHDRSMTTHPIMVSVASVIDRVRIVLAQKSVCFLLDDLDPQFPLQEAVSALVGHIQPGSFETTGAPARRLILTTSRFIPSAVRIDYHCALKPLELEDACTLFEVLTIPDKHSNRHSTQSLTIEHGYSQQICRALGNLPLAIVHTAHALSAERIPISLLTAQILMEPLNGMLNVGRQIPAIFEEAVSCLGPEMQSCFALLALLGPHPFSLESAASLYMNSSLCNAGRESIPSGLLHHSDMLSTMLTGIDNTGVPLAALTSTAIMLGRFVSHSLLTRLEIVDDDFANNPRYCLHPLLYAYARQCLRDLPSERVSQASETVLCYAEAYLERYQGSVAWLEREQDFLLEMWEMAWTHKNYGRVVRFTTRLLPVIEHFSDPIVGIEMLRCAVQASRKTDDDYHLSYLNSYLGLLYCYQGRLEAARQCWQDSLALADTLGAPPHLWRPYIYLAHLAYLHDDATTACTLADTFLQRVKESGDLRSLATAYLKRGSYKYALDDVDQAYEDICTALSLLFMLGVHASPSDQLLELAVRAKLAHVLGDQQSAARYLESAYALADMNSDPYVRALLLLEQVRLDHKQESSALTSDHQLQLPMPIGW